MLLSLKLKNFRNYKDCTLVLPPRFLFLVGPNGSGKSNLLEAIYYLGTGYSYRHHSEEALVSWGEDYFYVSGKVEWEKITYELEVSYHRGERKRLIRVNKKRATPAACFQVFPVVVFSPEDLSLIQGSPGVRRKFLDTVAAQVFPGHAAELQAYAGVLRQRNSLLKSPALERSILEPWDRQLARVGARILKRRLEVLRNLLSYSTAALSALTGGLALEGRYVSAVLGREEPPDELASIEESFSRALERNLPHERSVGFTLVGPHRDDYIIFLEGREARWYCSQGEQRLLALSLKVGQALLLKSVSNKQPLLLLDDIFSELDKKHKQAVFGHLMGFPQVISTGTGMEEFSWDRSQPVAVWELVNGEASSFLRVLSSS